MLWLELIVHMIQYTTLMIEYSCLQRLISFTRKKKEHKIQMHNRVCNDTAGGGSCGT